MTIRPFENYYPDIATTAYIDPSAVIIGQVSIGEKSSVWPLVVIRADINAVTIGKACSIQDGSIIHVTHAGRFNPEGYATTLGSNITVGHRVTLHGCEVQDNCLIGMDSCLMDGVIVESHVIIGAGSLVTPGTVCEAGYLWLGRPARKIRPITDKEREQIGYSAEYYAKLCLRYI